MSGLAWLYCVLSLFLALEPLHAWAVVVNGIAPAGENNTVSPEGSASVYTGHASQLRVYGTGLKNVTVIGWSLTPWSCDDTYQSAKLVLEGDNGDVATLATSPMLTAGIYYACADHVPLGDDPWLRLVVEDEPKDAIPKWLSGVIAVALLPLSALFAGLTLALMALDTTTLQLVMRSGQPREQAQARKIYPLRKYGNLLLCTLVLGNVLVNNTLTIVLDSLTGTGVAAVLTSTLAIMVFGEIVPQSIACRYGMAMGANTIYITYVFVVILFPLAWPIAKLMDLVLEKEMGVLYTREQLKELLRMTGKDVDIDKQEIDIVAGALEFSLKTVDEVMTTIDNVFMLDIKSRLDFATMTRIVKCGHSRIPVYDGDRSRIVGILFLRDLAFVDPDDNMALSTVIRFYNRAVHRVFEDTKLDDMLNEFRRGGCHMAIVQRVNASGEGDPFYEPVGLVTLEDVLEEIIKCEIVDETDVYVSNSTRDLVIRASAPQQHLDYRLFEDAAPTGPPHVTQAMRVAVLSFLTSSVPQFNESTMARGVVKRLVDHATYAQRCDDSPIVLYTAGEKTLTFTLVLQGAVEVITASDGLVFEMGPFQYLAASALTDPAYVPAFTARCVGPALLMQITREQYALASNATQLRRSPSMDPSSDEVDLFSGGAKQPQGKHKGLGAIIESDVPLDSDTVSVTMTLPESPTMLTSRRAGHGHGPTMPPIDTSVDVDVNGGSVIGGEGPCHV